MSLKYDLTNVPTDDLDEATCQAVIFGCLTTGIGSITAENAGEWYARHRIWSLAHQLEAIPRATVEAFVGLTTNASFEDESRVHWIMRVIAPLLDELQGGVVYEEEPPDVFAVTIGWDGDGCGPDDLLVERALRKGIGEVFPEEPEMVKVEQVSRPW